MSFRRLLGKFVSGETSHTLITNLVSTLLVTAAGVLAARFLGPDGRGHYAAIMAWFGLAQVLGEFGQSASATYFVARSPQNAGIVVRMSRRISGSGSVIVAGIGVALSGVLAEGYGDVQQAYVIVFLTCGVGGLYAPYVYAMQAIAMRYWNVLRLSQPFFYIIGIGVGLIANQLSIVYMAWVLAASVVLQSVLARLFAGRLGVSKGEHSAGACRDLLKYGALQFSSAVPTTLGNQFDKIVLSRVASPSELGQYAVASSVASLAMPVATAIGSVVFPRLARNLGRGAARIVGLEMRSMVSTLLICLTVVLVLAASSRWLVPLVFGSAFLPAVSLVWWLVPYAVFSCLAAVGGSILRGHGRPGLVTASQTAGLVVAATGIIFSAGRFGLPAVALWLGVGQLIVSVTQTLALWRIVRAGVSAQTEVR